MIISKFYKGMIISKLYKYMIMSKLYKDMIIYHQKVAEVNDQMWDKNYKTQKINW